jgi:nicotinate-nucleotide pyrophosphorylase (carboxylating)
VDTGRLEDLEACQAELAQLGAREQIQVAFAGNVHIADIPDMARRGIDLLCIGKEIVDAGLLDMKLDVVEEMKA